MCVTLRPAESGDLETLWAMQIKAFAELLEKYQDDDISPGAESLDRVRAKFSQPWTTYYFIDAGGEHVGAMRIIDKKDGSRKRISPIWIMPGFRNRGYAQAAIREAEKLYGPDHWCLDTILQEKGNLHLYEKMGYHRTGRVEKISDRMDIVFYEKDCITFRALRVEDYDQAYALWTSAKNMGLNSLDDTREGIARFLARNPSTCFAAEADGRIVGVLLCGHDGRRAYLYHLAVAEAFRRQKIASGLLDRCLDALKTEGIHKAALVVFSRNEEGNAFWESREFTVRNDLVYRNRTLTEMVRFDT